jgi:hypothetical protein
MKDVLGMKDFELKDNVRLEFNSPGSDVTIINTLLQSRQNERLNYL